MDYILILIPKFQKMTRKREGFKGQQAIVLPVFIQEECKLNSLTKLLYTTDIGSYPEARYHFRERNEGSDQHILVYCLEGSGWLEVNGNRQLVGIDQYFVIPAQMPHRYGASNATPWSIRWLHFSGEKADLFVDPVVRVKEIESSEPSRFRDRLQLFEEIYRSLTMGYSRENLEYSSVCLWHFLGSFVYSSQYQRIREIQKHDIIEKSVLYMQEHVDKPLNLNELASHCGYSVSHFSMIFKKKTTRSPIEYFLGLKIQKACQMLDFSSMRVQEIASELAFLDQFYFSRLFRKMIGVSPVEYRKKKKG
jgi:AraC-like DNA-binding protein